MQLLQFKNSIAAISDVFILEYFCTFFFFSSQYFPLSPSFLGLWVSDLHFFLLYYNLFWRPWISSLCSHILELIFCLYIYVIMNCQNSFLYYLGLFTIDVFHLPFTRGPPYSHLCCRYKVSEYRYDAAFSIVEYRHTVTEIVCVSACVGEHIF